jgi:glycosyltransferase involved in cell wall biosynthesis
MAIMRIVHLTLDHSPFDTRIFHKQCKTLARAGYDVVLIAPHIREERVDGVLILPVPTSTRRAMRLMRFYFQVYKVALRQKAYLYHFHDPELIPIGVLLKLRGKKVIYDVHEDLPQHVFINPRIPRWFRLIVAVAARGMQGVTSWMFNGISAATPTIASRFPQKKTLTVQNFPILGELNSSVKRSFVERPRVAVYVGDITVIRGAKEMIHAMDALPESVEAKLVIAGKFNPSELEYEVSEMAGWKRVEYLRWRDRAEIARILSNARMGLVVLHPRANYLDSYPVKLFEYMSAGIPVIASNFPLWRGIIERAKAGLLVDPLDPKAIAEAIQWLLENPEKAEAMGKSGQEAVQQSYNWDSEAQKLLKLYTRLVG